MTETRLPQGLRDRLARVRGFEQQILEQLEQLLGGMRGDPAADQLAAAQSLATRHLSAIDELARRRGLDLGTFSKHRDRSDEASLALRVEGLAGTVASLITAYGALYAAGRLLYETEFADDLAYPHAGEWRDMASVITDLLVTEVHAELLAEGDTCRCVCPACGMGACLCTRTSIDTLREFWGRPAAEPGQGIELRIAPRPGSEMARVGLTQGDRIVLVDGEVVQTNSDLQAALRKHPIGEPIAMRVERSGRSEEIRAARVSDFP
jgi:PDZ domain